MATDAASIISIALQLLAARAALILTLAATIGFFAWAFWYHSWIPLVIAIAFAVLVLWPVLWKDNRRADKDST